MWLCELWLLATAVLSTLAPLLQPSSGGHPAAPPTTPEPFMHQACAHQLLLSALLCTLLLPS